MDVDVFKQRFLPFHPKLYRIAYALLDNKADAEDILQDAYCKLWNKRDELGDIQNPEAFSITLVKNLKAIAIRLSGKCICLLLPIPSWSLKR